MMSKKTVPMLIVAALTALGAVQLAHAQSNSGRTLRKADPYTDGAKVGKPDPYLDGAKSDSKFDPYTGGAKSSTRTDLAPRKADPYTDGAKVGKPDPYLDGARTGKPDPYTDGAKHRTSGWASEQDAVRAGAARHASADDRRRTPDSPRHKPIQIPRFGHTRRIHPSFIMQSTLWPQMVAGRRDIQQP